MIFSLEQLLAFVTVYEYGSFSKAAAKLDKHRTTVAQVIGNLEDLVGVELFERVGRSVEATEEGHLLYRYGKQVIEQARAFDKFALSLSMGQLETLNIGYCSFLPHSMLTDVRQHLAERYPSMTVNFSALSKNEIKQGITDGSLQVGIVNIEERSVIHSMNSAFLGELHLAGYAAKGSKMLTIPKDRLYSAMKSERQLVLKAMIDDEVENKVILSANYEVIDQLSLVIKMVQMDMGWAILPRGLALSDYIKEHLVELKPPEVPGDLGFPLAVWSPYTKQLATIQQEITDVAMAYLKAERAS
ncbi:LysR family transcriptional regulator [Ferrimonas balearica]|uniref:LysR family transcriptional regulator n=1 Tax=Ferrimonas balearica TaxID=44012 RepID=UPI001C9A1CF4|nr:LysR family transcriptional regulator [Ferrimonas balearica]MBY5991135.1 LysR family transcriptional regulator [Ferrimonas balearica]